ncbi:dTDP-4-dehydrorhamnose reductase [Zeaxanthinibacter enoshimensis]|uniref:dTDP-4-dehydrorhamnose reductase n=1 Tax=Zeaxanthinibacter enoshimensis TaxID=392009 RepID=A0A4R6TQP9_9FLAO|nr:dTDP-4-dehydrorhamnose reductase [Zeaxanthinibacter enoshimensis]TDQ32786.1 dTDP-4-dehydrorhamnose reductase [Zeaxanthinibacter enoshimensis]
MKQVLVTGAGGQLARCLQKMPQDSEVRFTFVNKATMDITDPISIRRILDNTEFDYCINCAAYTDVETAEKSPKKAFEVNAEGVRNLAGSCESRAITLIHISTDYVFDGEKEGPYLATDIPNPINEYGKSKLLGEEYIKRLMTRYFIIRTSWLYSEFGSNFYTKIRDKAEKGETLYITDEQIGCPTDANNLAQYLRKIISGGSEDYGIYHFTDGVPMSWYQWAINIVNDMALDASSLVVRHSNYRTFAARPRNSVLKTQDQG